MRGDAAASRSRAISVVEPLGFVLRQAARRLVEDDERARRGRSPRRSARICCWPMVSSRDGPAHVDVGAGRREHRLGAPPHLARARRTPRRAGSEPRQRFSATDRLSQNASSWWTMPMPAASACCGSAETDRRAVTSIDVPGVGRDRCRRGSCRACSCRRRSRRRARGRCPAAIEKLTSSSATTPGKALGDRSKRDAQAGGRHRMFADLRSAAAASGTPPARR